MLFVNRLVHMLVPGSESEPVDTSCRTNAGFAAGLDDRIQCECVSCYPAIADDTCNCAWRFRMEG